MDNICLFNSNQIHAGFSYLSDSVGGGGTHFDVLPSGVWRGMVGGCRGEVNL